MFDNGLVLEDKTLLAVLLDDADALEKIITGNPSVLQKRYSFNCAFTPLYEASLVHICAEYNQRTEKDIYEIVSLLMKAQYGIDYAPSNIPNKYLIP